MEWTSLYRKYRTHKPEAERGGILNRWPAGSVVQTTANRGIIPSCQRLNIIINNDVLSLFSRLLSRRNNNHIRKNVHQRSAISLLCIWFVNRFHLHPCRWQSERRGGAISSDDSLGTESNLFFKPKISNSTGRTPALTLKSRVNQRVTISACRIRKMFRQNSLFSCLVLALFAGSVSSVLSLSMRTATSIATITTAITTATTTATATATTAYCCLLLLTTTNATTISAAFNLRFLSTILQE